MFAGNLFKLFAIVVLLACPNIVSSQEVSGKVTSDLPSPDEVVARYILAKVAMSYWPAFRHRTSFGSMLTTESSGLLSVGRCRDSTMPNDLAMVNWIRLTVAGSPRKNRRRENWQVSPGVKEWIVKST